MVRGCTHGCRLKASKRGPHQTHLRAAIALSRLRMADSASLNHTLRGSRWVPRGLDLHSPTRGLEEEMTESGHDRILVGLALAGLSQTRGSGRDGSLES